MTYFCDSYLPIWSLERVRHFLYILLCGSVFLSCHPSSGGYSGHSGDLDLLFSRLDSLDSGHGEKPLIYLDSVYGRMRYISEEALYRKYDYKVGYFQNKRMYVRANVYADSLLGLFPDKEYEGEEAKQYARALFLKGDILQRMKSFKNAFLLYYKGWQQIRKTGDTCVLAEYSSRLGTTCYSQGLYEDGIRYYQTAFAELSYCMDKKDAFRQFALQQGTLDNIALCYDQLGMNDSAAFYYDSTLKYIARGQRRFLVDYGQRHYIELAKGVVYGNEADTRYKKGDTAGAEKLYRQSIQINMQKGYANEDAQFTMAKLAGLYLSGGHFGKTGETLKELEQSLDSLPSPDATLMLRRMQWRYSDSLKQVEDAYAYYQSYIQLRDTLNAGPPSTDVNEELQHISREYELELLRARDKLKTGSLVIAVVSLLAMISVSLVVWYSSRRSRRHVRQLTRMNERERIQNKHLHKTLSALEQSQRENARIIKIIAHDLRNPIGAIGSIAAILSKKPNVPPDQQPLLELIRTSSQHSLEMINDLLHLGTTPEEMKKEKVDLEAELRYGADMLQFKAEAKQQHIILKTVPVTLMANREKLWRVLSNLITNAIKFSPADTEILVEVIPGKDRVRILVKDQGIGIPEEQRDTIFNLFTESKRRGTAGEESFGLGLSISKQIVEAHGGRIWYESAVGVGTTFYVELPLEEAAPLRSISV